MPDRTDYQRGYEDGVRAAALVAAKHDTWSAVKKYEGGSLGPPVYAQWGARNVLDGICALIGIHPGEVRRAYWRQSDDAPPAQEGGDDA